MKLVTKIPRRVAGRDLQPGDEFEVDDKTARVLVQSGHAEAVPEKPKAAPAAQPAPAPAVKASEPAAKASTEVKPMTLADAPNQGEYATRDLKAKG